MPKLKEIITTENIKFWITIISVVVSVTIWGVRLESRIDRLSDKLDTSIEATTENKTHIAIVTTSLNDAWKQITILNTLHNK